jgi:hypothetical protein
MPATPKVPFWVGSTALVEVPTSPRQKVEATKTSISRCYEGLYAVAQSSVPTIGQTFADLPGTVEVVGTDLEKLPGNIGRLTIDLETPYETTYECEWVEIDKALIQNPRYWNAAAGDMSDGAKSLSMQDRTMIERWEQEDDPTYKLAFQFKVMQDATTTAIGTAMPTSTNVSIAGYSGMFNIYTLSTNAQDYAKKRLKGEEAYRLYAPVIRQTSESLDPPDTSAAGVIQQPPEEAGEIIPPGYYYLLSAKRVVRTGPYGKYRLQAEWQGAQQIDGDLYPTVAS